MYYCLCTTYRIADNIHHWYLNELLSYDSRADAIIKIT